MDKDCIVPVQLHQLIPIALLHPHTLATAATAAAATAAAAAAAAAAATAATTATVDLATGTSASSTNEQINCVREGAAVELASLAAVIARVVPQTEP
jgi:hypothetical protein